MLLGFHALWLAPYGGRYRNASVTIDRRHHAAHLWVDRFAVPGAAQPLVEHLLWIVSKLDEVLPVVHARFVGATMAQKDGGLGGDPGEPFVLGGNPLLAIHRAGGEAAIDAWSATQTAWSREELAQMLRELAIELVTQRDPDDDDDDDDDDVDDDRRAPAVAVRVGGDGDDDDHSRYIARYAGELLEARARAGALDPRAASWLRPLLATPEKYEHRRRAVVGILGALGDRASVPALIQILDDNPLKSALEAIGKEDLLAATAAALGAIGDPRAVPALARLVAAPGDHHDEPRPAAAEALASCHASAPAPVEPDDAVLTAVLTAIAGARDGEASAALHIAYVRLARLLSPPRRALAHRRLEETPPGTDRATATLARQAALVLARGEPLDAAAAAALRPLVHDGLTELAYDHDDTIRRIRTALRVAELLPELVDPEDLGWLTRLGEPDVRTRVHALLAQLGRPLPPARLLDRRTAQALEDRELARLIGEPHVIDRAILVAEAGRRGLAAARPTIIKAAHDAIGNARQGNANLMEPDSRLLEVVVRVLRASPLDTHAISLFDRMLRHSNFHVKWELLQDPPHDERLIPGMFHVLGERWGWQEKAARQWLSRFQGTPTYEAERVRGGAPTLLASDEDGAADRDDVDDDAVVN